MRYDTRRNCSSACASIATLAGLIVGWRRRSAPRCPEVHALRSPPVSPRYRTCHLKQRVHGQPLLTRPALSELRCLNARQLLCWLAATSLDTTTIHELGYRLVADDGGTPVPRALGDSSSVLPAQMVTVNSSLDFWLLHTRRDAATSDSLRCMSVLPLRCCSIAARQTRPARRSNARPIDSCCASPHSNGGAAVPRWLPLAYAERPLICISVTLTRHLETKPFKV